VFPFDVVGGGPAWIRRRASSIVPDRQEGVADRIKDQN
jgi:hypothetical protein